ncbi:MAG: MFS transporter [Deferrisomatales bacterium]
MSTAELSRRTLRFVNAAHALDHFVLLVFPTAVLAIVAERGVSYAEWIRLATGAFVAFGLCSLPAGWLADRLGRRNLLAAFFAGCGLSCLGLALASTPAAFAVGLTALGAFAGVYHPVGSAWLVSHAGRLGRDLGVNGVWGNLGAAFASGVTAALAAWVGWRLSFAVPGIVCLTLGALFLARVPGDGDTVARAKKASAAAVAVTRPRVLLALFAAAIVAGGFTFNLTTVSLPKVLDERLGFALPLAAVGSVATAVFLAGALTQLTVGRLIERFPLPGLFVGLSVLQPLGLGLAALTTGAPLLAGLVLAVAAIYGQVVINDAMVARYVPGRYQARAFGLRYFIGFTTAGAAVPLLAALHGLGGFVPVLAAAAGFGGLIFGAALGFFALARPAPAADLPAGAPR